MEIFRKIFLSIFILIITAILWFALMGPERVFFFYPYIDTKMVEGYSVSKFNEIKVGMTKNEVESIMGKPLSIFRDSSGTVIFDRYSYTSDGKLQGKKVPFFMFNDYAWFASEVLFGLDERVIEVGKGWAFD